MILATSTSAFLTLHAAVAAATRAPFQEAFRVTRGIASVGLAAIGFAVMIGARDLAPLAWIVPERGPLAPALIQVALRHFIADALLLAWGARRHGERPRPDLIAHHVLGGIGGGLALALHVAQELYLVLFTSELMPVTTGLSAIGALRGSAALEALGARLRLGVLLGWRLPLWALLAALFVANLASGPDPLRRTALLLCLGLLVPLVALDASWVRKSLRALRRSPGPADADRAR